MIANSPAQRLRIYICEDDKAGHTPLYEAIVHQAYHSGLAGATVWRGVMSYGHSHHIHTRKILELSAALPMMIEIVDDDSKISVFLTTLAQLFQQAGCDGLVTREAVQAIRFERGEPA